MNTEEKEWPSGRENSAAGRLASFTQSPGAKFVLIGFITLLLMFPALMVWVLVEERAGRATATEAEIATGWGGEQVINGPYLVLPYSITQDVDNQPTRVIRHAVISPQEMAFDAGIDVEERKKSIYTLAVYTSRIAMKGKFGNVDTKAITAAGGSPDFTNAFLVIGISDVTGFRSDANIRIDNGETNRFEPGSGGLATTGRRVGSNRIRHSNSAANRAIQYPVSITEARQGFAFEIDMALNGSKSLSVVPNAENSAISINSAWPHPGFSGTFLPEKRDISDAGFEAEWTIPSLARGIPSVNLVSSLQSSGGVVQVKFVEVLKFYQIVSRTLKYAVGFIGLIFLAVFVLELRGAKTVHWIQYILVGMAMVVFYVLLLALAEQVGFTLAYLLAAAATTLLVAWYVGDALGQTRGSLVMGVVLTIAYAFIYFLINEDEYALLAGSIIAFLSIAATMVATRNTDWSRRRLQNS